MKKEIMKRAWEIKKENKDNVFALCLKLAWKEAKDMKRINELLNRLEVAGTDEKYNEKMTATTNHWAKNGYSRTYISAKRFRNGRMQKEFCFGYYDREKFMVVTGSKDQDLEHFVEYYESLND